MLALPAWPPLALGNISPWSVSLFTKKLEGVGLQPGSGMG